MVLQTLADVDRDMLHAIGRNQTRVQWVLNADRQQCRNVYVSSRICEGVLFIIQVWLVLPEFLFIPTCGRRIERVCDRSGPILPGEFATDVTYIPLSLIPNSGETSPVNNTVDTPFGWFRPKVWKISVVMRSLAILERIVLSFVVHLHINSPFPVFSFLFVNVHLTSCYV